MKKLSALLLALSLSACGSGGNSPAAPTQADRGVFSAAIEPSPLTVVGTGNAQEPNRVALTLVVSESAGLGGSVNFANATLTANCRLGTTQSGPFQIGANGISSQAGSNHVGARAALRIPLSINFACGGMFITGILRMEVNVTDDHRNTTTLTTLAPMF